MTSEALRKFEEVTEELCGTSPATKGKMFGMACLKINGKAFAGFHKEAMVFKLTSPAHAEALALEGAHLFDPAMGRPMKEWVVVPLEYAERWLSLGWSALHYLDKTA